MNGISRRDWLHAAAAAVSAPLLARALEAESRLRPELSGERGAMQRGMDRDLLEVTIAKLHALYAARTYTPSQVTRWYLDRIARYTKVYRPILHVDAGGALATAAALERSVKGGKAKGPLWGVPIVIKSNTSVKGLITSAGWSGYLIPGYELVAPKDATVVAKLKAAGAIILGQTNMPDFAASDTNISSAFGRTGNAYNWRCSPGGSSGGTVTSVAANLCVLGTGTDTGNSIRMPAGTSSVVGILPTRGLVSIAGIHPLDWLRDNTGPIARTVADACIALDVMAGEDPGDFRTKGSAAQAEAGPNTRYLNATSLEGKRFGVPAFIVSTTPRGTPLQPETRDMFLKSLGELRAAGATVVVDDAVLPESFQALIQTINTGPYVGEGVDSFLRDYGPPAYHSAAEYTHAVGSLFPAFMRGSNAGSSPAPSVEADPNAETTLWAPQRRAVAAYDETLDRFQLDGYVYPAVQMPPPDEVALLDQGRRSDGPHSNTAWVNPIGVPAISIPGGFYTTGLPFGLELSAKRWRDGDLVGWAYGYEQATKHRRPPNLVDTRGDSTSRPG
ncbi:MAG TPA: amidase [Gemmatimonadaceae bacterium]|jgi:Asp-tRNA(Asn)/Glu-tRNA(Gln) amidotransferase A subunit family amidase|nr:amidase [Gemmatimonadaceae bacterium]